MAQSRTAQQDTNILARDSFHPADGHLYWVLEETTDPRRDKSRILDVNGGFLTPDLYSWILASPDFAQWRREKKKPLLCIQGGPGSGKTMQLCGIIDDLEKAAPRTVNYVGFLSFFFCQGTDSRSNNATAVLRGLIHVLVQQHPSLRKHIRRGHKRTRSKNSTNNPSIWTALSDMFSRILEDPAVRRRGTCFIIDALDECETALPDLLDLIVRTSSEAPHVKWIVSSRSSLHIEERLRAAFRHLEIIELLFQLNQDTVSVAVGAYAQHAVRELADRNEYDAVTEAAIRDYLASTNESFLWTALVCRSLVNVPQSDALEHLRACPRGLDPLYAHMVQEIEESGHGEICKRVLALVTAARGPISLQELSLFLEIPEDQTASTDHDHHAFLAEAVRRCWAFLAFHNDAIYFAHSSAKAFLLSGLKDLDDGAFASCVHETSTTIFSKSLEAMSQTLRRDIYHLQHLGSTTDQVQKPDPDPLVAVRYSCIYWVDHLLDANRDSESGDLAYGGDVVHTFLREKYLYWLEGLSLLKCIPEGMRAMEKLEGFLRLEFRKPDLLELVVDARRFVLAHGSVIAHAPLQTYASALVFSPAGSLVRELSKEQEPRWITQKPTTDYPESHGGPVWTVRFSPTNAQKLAASASDDKTLKIWDVTTGTCVRTFHGHEDWIWSFTFSGAGDQIASASDDGTVKIWEVNTGQCIQTIDGHGDAAFQTALSLYGHHNRVWGVSFSRNGEQIVSCSPDKTVKIWDSATGQCLQTLTGHTRAVCVATFWKNNMVVSGGFDKSIRIWDVKSGNCVKTLVDDNGVFSVVFSHDGQRLASSSNHIRIWDTSTWECLHTLGISQPTYSIAYSSDDSIIASASKDGLVKIWDALAGRLDRVLGDHYGGASFVTFSRSCQVLASSSMDGEIALWNVGSGARLHSLMHGTEDIPSLAFARGDRQLVSVSDNGTVCIWSTMSGICLQCFEGSNGPISFVTFSHDCQQIATAADDDTVVWDVVYGSAVWSASFSSKGKLLATCSGQGTVRLWDVATGKCHEVFCHHTDAVYATAFSHDGMVLAAASDDRTITISKMNGVCLRRLEGHSGGVWAVAFSPDDRQIASAANDRTLRVWDAATGECLQVIDVDASLSSISFDTTGSYLCTELGRIKLSKPKTPPPPPSPPGSASETAETAAAVESSHDTPFQGASDSDQHDYGVSADRRWITDNGKNVLWLPREYRPLSVAISERTICIGCRSGRVLFLGF